MIILNDLLAKLPQNSYNYLNPDGENHIISEVMVMASPDIKNWIIPNELILTSFYGLDANQKEKLIISLKNHQAGGLVVKKNEYLKKIPTELIALSQHIGLPLIEIQNIKYREIINSFTQLKINSIQGIEAYLDQYWEHIFRKLLSEELTNKEKELLFNKLSIKEKDNLRLISLRDLNLSFKIFKIIINTVINCDRDAILGFIQDNLYILINENKYNLIREQLITIKNAHFIAGDLFQINNFIKAKNDLSNIRKLTNCLSFHQNFISYENLGINKLFISLPTNTLIRTLLTKKLQKFWQENPDLCKSLRTYFNSSLNITMAAKKLYIHPKTLTYRLHKVEKILTVDLNNTSEIVNLNICLNLLYLQEKGFFVG
ncbi:PucR family transcriptional regulator [Liquorilactobacillus sicerae]|uniref:PucR family transcriptional regulator n=1 Tax=Liquorilactobacillus sicerae TaxID=1416943 RepID=UPI00248071E7|nr:PucR family transcriptional regulator [Liquorilactobacillus sicerae]